MSDDQATSPTPEPETTPTPGSILVADDAAAEPTGTPAIYVRTEQRGNGSEPEALLLIPRDRLVYQRWVPLDALAAWRIDYRPPAEVSLSGERLAAVYRQLDELRADRTALVAAMKTATELAPEHAQAIRRAYREGKP